ncbi:hypothetical protein GCM10011404_34060 [Sphingomonas prati]|uniref:Sel1 repeat family protein n=2 Tax=Sphingomonas prati TaxID=1843237 RepID=A0A7W9BVL6_9SPHN|nr:tetratricopeptide repeat protein [Sphingomonas prati]MBB5730949.1 hypothetical protein [Sphingomonas prati]GGE98106.1 hypothetical protein GCM10011404_34060 [Sphingomonas prati]
MTEYVAALALCDQAEPDLVQAHLLLKRAAEHGDDRAKYALATWYLHGNDAVEKNERLGVSMLKKLANSNVAEAVFDLAIAYDYGRQVRRNEKKAFSFYMRAALLGDRESCSQLAQFFKEGKIVDANPVVASAWERRAQEEERDISPPYRQWLQ